MPTFTAITLDRLLEPGASKSVDKSLPKPKPIPNSNRVPNSKLERRNSTSSTERKVQRPQIKPALYTTPESTPLPGSPTSFPPSPYIINHKRRGPRLLKSYSEDDVSLRQKAQEAEKLNYNTRDFEIKAVKSPESKSLSVAFPPPNGDELVNSVQDCGSSTSQSATVNDQFGCNGEHKSNGMSNGLARQDDSSKAVVSNSESEDFLDPKESMSMASNNDLEDTIAEHSGIGNLPMGEFFDAWEELSSDSGLQLSVCNLEDELREIRLSLLMEIEKRKQAEESLATMLSHWQRLRQQLSLVGLTLPADPTAIAEGGQLDSDPAEDLCQQIYVARFVSDSIGRGTARAKMEIEMEAQIESKNFEIARLCDRLHYYEAVNHEMSQRNQEAVELARRERLQVKRRQKWIWGSVATALTLGTAALAWSYIPSGTQSSSINHSQTPQHDDGSSKD